MKTLNLLLCSMLILLSSCSKDDPTDFTGNYSGEIICIGGFQSEPGETTNIVIIENSDGTYSISIDEESNFIGTGEDNVLTIARQRPIGADFEPYLEGTITDNGDGTFTLSAKVDEDGEVYNCTSILIK